MQNPRYYHNVAVIYIEFYNCYTFDAIYALHEKLDNMVIKHNILKAGATHRVTETHFILPRIFVTTTIKLA